LRQPRCPRNPIRSSPRSTPASKHGLAFARPTRGGADNGEEPGALEEQTDEACTADNEALIAVLTTRPTTIAGVLALLEFACACDAEHDKEILEINDPNNDMPTEGYGYHTLLDNLIDALRPLVA
jgi:hypothetical protein